MEQTSDGGADKPRPPATNPSSRITRTQRSDHDVHTPLDLRCVHVPVTTGFHDDQNPSLQTYQDGSWYCFGCTRGGSIYDFAALLWLTGTKDREFIKLRARLADQLLGVARA